MAFDNESFLYGSLRAFYLFTTVGRNSRVLRHLIVIYISSYELFVRRLFSSRIHLHRRTYRLPRARFCFRFLIDCASTRECTTSHTLRCLTRQIFTGTAIKWENGYPSMRTSMPCMFAIRIAAKYENGTVRTKHRSKARRIF